MAKVTVHVTTQVPPLWWEIEWFKDRVKNVERGACKWLQTSSDRKMLDSLSLWLFVSLLIAASHSHFYATRVGGVLG